MRTLAYILELCTLSLISYPCLNSFPSYGCILAKITYILFLISILLSPGYCDDTARLSARVLCYLCAQHDDNFLLLKVLRVLTSNSVLFCSLSCTCIIVFLGQHFYSVPLNSSVASIVFFMWLSYLSKPYLLLHLYFWLRRVVNMFAGSMSGLKAVGE